MKFRSYLVVLLALSFLPQCAKLDDSFYTHPYFSDASQIPPTKNAASANVVFLHGNSGLGPTQIGVVVNDLDLQSVAVGEYYQAARHVPAENMIHVSFPKTSSMSVSDFTNVRNQVWAATPAEVQAYVLTWTYPWKVDGAWWAEGMAISSAFALGYDSKWFTQRPDHSNNTNCQPTAQSPYYASSSKRPYTDFGIRPTMQLGGLTLKDVTDVIDRGVESDGTHPVGKNYLLRSSDPARNVRYPDFVLTSQLPQIIPGSVEYLDYEVVGGTVAYGYIENKPDIMGYFTGFGGLPLQYAGNTFLKGAVADNLTSCFGYWDFPSPTTDPYSMNSGCYQGASLAFLKAGATATSGAVVEPCNYTQKFPQTSVFLPQYQSGKTVVESYFASVQQPGELNFAGEPLANPYAIKPTLSFDSEAQTVTVSTAWPVPGALYRLEKSTNINGPYSTEMDSIPSNPAGGITTFTIPNPENISYYRLREISVACGAAAPGLTVDFQKLYAAYGSPKVFALTVTNNNPFGCPASTVSLSASGPGVLNTLLSETSVSLQSSESKTVLLTASASPTIADGEYGISVTAARQDGGLQSTSLLATYVADSTLPSVPVVSWAPAYGLPGQVLVNWTESVDGSPPIHYNVWLNGVKVASDLTYRSYAATVPYGSSLVVVEATDQAGNAVESAPLALNRLLPEPPSITFNAGAPSMLKKVIVTFNQAVTPEPGAILITDQLGTVLDFSWIYSQMPTGESVWTATYESGNSLADGNYSVSIVPDLLYTNFLDVYPASTQGFFRFFGDYNGDRFVNNVDYNQFKLAFGSQVGSPQYKVGFDYNVDGFISNPDYNQFKLRFGLFLAP